MPKKERPLPQPPSRAARFGECEERPGAAPLMADQMAMAAAGGRLEEFIDKAIPDNEHAKKLAAMMMGMTGMLPAGHPAPPPGKGEDSAPAPASAAPQPEAVSCPPSEEILRAVQDEDVSGLIDLLKQEHSRRTGDPEPAAATAGLPQGPPAQIEKTLIDRVIAVASGNALTPDWIIMRALKLYFEEYDKTGRL
ncbi:MAG: hypothetical protein M0024_14510 [Nitrospiraceae bacterium]|nr:hypothetical protein [Nitrospiraceae bacterium]